MTDQPRGAFRPIPDPGAEVERLARLRNDPPGRVWGVRHPDGHVTHHETASKPEVTAWREAWNHDCPHCGPEPRVIGGHTLVYRDTPPWRDE